MFALLQTGCYVARWAESAQLEEYPQEISRIWKANNGVYVIPATVPGYAYPFDIAEKDRLYDSSDHFRFTSVEIRLQPKTVKGQVLADFVFLSKAGLKVQVPGVDLLRLVPKINAPQAYHEIEILEEEYNRFGYSFRREHQEFSVLDDGVNLPTEEKSAVNRSYRCSIINNCLAAGKWEFTLVAEEYEGFSKRRLSRKNVNQNRLLAHSWFQVDPELYSTLVELKNGQKFEMTTEYQALSDAGEETKIDFEELRAPIKRKIPTLTWAVGHKLNLPVKPVDVEQHFKKQFGLMLDTVERLTYRSILEQPIRTAQFRDEGFYKTETPKEFDWSWLKGVDKIEVRQIEDSTTDCLVELKLTGKWAAYDITIGNIDLALLRRRKRWGQLFGFNTYPKSRRYNPAQNAMFVDIDFVDPNRTSYLLMTDKKTGKWVNNQYKGVEKIYLSYSNNRSGNIDVYLLSYERIVPVWTAKVKLPRSMRETIRIKNNLYNY